MPFRISIAGLLAVISFVAVAFASLHEATDLWAKAMLSLAIAVFGVALLGLLFRRGVERATWAGSFVFGAGYLTLCCGPWCDTHVMPRLLTTTPIDDDYLRMHYSPKHVGETVWGSSGPGDPFIQGEVFDISTGPVKQFHIATARGTTARYGPTQLRAISLEAYRELCHSDWSLLFAFIGAGIGRYFAGRDETAERPPS